MYTTIILQTCRNQAALTLIEKTEKGRQNAADVMAAIDALSLAIDNGNLLRIFMRAVLILGFGFSCWPIAFGFLGNVPVAYKT